MLERLHACPRLYRSSTGLLDTPREAVFFPAPSNPRADPPAAAIRLVPPGTGHVSAVWSVSWSPDRRWLASGGADGTVRLWEAATGKALRALEGHKGPV